MATSGNRGPGRSAFRGIAAMAGAVGWAAAAALGAIMAVVFAVSLLIISVFAALLLPLAVAAMKARRSVRTAADPNLLEARHLGGHSWVVYSWDGR